MCRGETSEWLPKDGEIDWKCNENEEGLEETAWVRRCWSNCWKTMGKRFMNGFAGLGYYDFKQVECYSSKLFRFIKYQFWSENFDQTIFKWYKFLLKDVHNWASSKIIQEPYVHHFIEFSLRLSTQWNFSQYSLRWSFIFDNKYFTNFSGFQSESQIAECWIKG